MINNQPKVSVLEKVIINWATPFEAFRIWPFYRITKAQMNPKTEKYFQKYGVFIGMCRSKIVDYKRLIRSQKYGDSEDILRLYEETPCGKVMISSCRFFHCS